MEIIEIGGNVRDGIRVGRGNAGDTALGSAFRHLFEGEFPGSKIKFMECRKIFTKNDISEINKSDLIFVAGGGLFLPDNFKNDVSDWEWGISADLIEKIKIPIIVYSVGYNKFRGQNEFRDVFDKSVSKLLEKSLFFSLRNSGSIRSIRRHVDHSLREKVKLNFCPTLLENHSYIRNDIRKKKTVAFVLSGDHSKNRHKNLEEFGNEINKFVKFLKQNNYETILINHLYDYWILKYANFDKFVELYNKPADYIYKTYSQIDTVVSDRGHGQMIPYACGCKVLSPVSHDKLHWFLEDVGLEEFGIEANDLQLSEKLIHKFKKLQELDWQKINSKGMEFIKDTNNQNKKFIKENVF